MNKQHTIGGKLSLEGVGLHTGEKSRLELVPAPDNTGIIFSRRDAAGSNLIKGDIYSVLGPEQFPRRTSIASGDVCVQTIEHLMAAFHLLGVDNVQVNIWGEEIPGLDGSAKDFVDAIQNAGLSPQAAVRNYLVVKEPLWVEEGDCRVVILPSHEFRISYGLQYDNPLIGSTYMELKLNGSLSGKDVCDLYRARTFCLEEEVKPLLDMGLGRGSNYDNTLVVSKAKIINNKLRFPDEFIKHKVLDLIGDLYLIGPMKAHVIAMRSGHSLNIKLLQKLRKYRESSQRSGISAQTSYIPCEGELNVEDIMKILPHRYPFLLVDKITYLDKGKRACGIKNVTMNEYFFQGHFPDRPVMPGVLIVEAMAQVGGVLMLACPEHRGKLAYFMAANNIKFRKPVTPGDQLMFEVEAGKVRTRTGTVHARALVAGKVVTEGDLMFALVD